MILDSVEDGTNKECLFIRVFLTMNSITSADKAFQVVKWIFCQELEPDWIISVANTTIQMLWVQKSVWNKEI
jgi:hypothetical protein